MDDATTIRRLTPADAAAVRAIRQVALGAHPDAFHSTVEEGTDSLEGFERRLERNRYFGAFSGETLVGLAQLALDTRDREKLRHKAEVANVYVAPAHRGDGTARKLLRSVIAEARERRYEALWLSVAETNRAAVTLYENLGFVRYGLELRAMKLADRRYGDDLLMQLEL